MLAEMPVEKESWVAQKRGREGTSEDGPKAPGSWGVIHADAQGLQEARIMRADGEFTVRSFLARPHQLARNMGVPTNRVTQILHGTRSVTGDTALRLAHFFGTTAQFWLNLQNLYDLRLAQKKAGKSVKALPRLKRRELVHA